MNGQDVSQSSHDEAVEAFLQAQEPITVEVLRRKPGGQQQQQQGDSLEHRPGSGNSRAGSESRYSSKRSSVAFSESLSNSIAIQTDVILGVNDILESGSLNGSRPGSSTADVLGFIPDLDYEVRKGRESCGVEFTEEKKIGEFFLLSRNFGAEKG